MPPENEAVVRRWIDEVLNQGNLQLIDELYASDFVNHSAPDQPPGPEGVKQGTTALRQAFPDLQVTVDDLISSGDRVAYRFTVRGTHNGDFAGIKPTGKPISYTGMIMARMAGGRYAEGWGVQDLLPLLEQIGAVGVTGAEP